MRNTHSQTCYISRKERYWFLDVNKSSFRYCDIYIFIKISKLYMNVSYLKEQLPK